MKTTILSLSLVFMFGVVDVMAQEKSSSPNSEAAGIKSVDGRFIVTPETGLWTVTRTAVYGGSKQKSYLCLGKMFWTPITVPGVNTPVKFGFFSVPTTAKPNTHNSYSRFNLGEKGAYFNTAGILLMGSLTLGSNVSSSPVRVTLFTTALTASKIYGIDVEYAMGQKFDPNNLASSVGKIVGTIYAEKTTDSKNLCFGIK